MEPKSTWHRKTTRAWCDVKTRVENVAKQIQVTVLTFTMITGWKAKFSST